MLIISRILVVVVIQSAQAARDKAVFIDGFVALYSKKTLPCAYNFLDVSRETNRFRIKTDYTLLPYGLLIRICRNRLLNWYYYLLFSLGAYDSCGFYAFC